MQTTSREDIMIQELNSHNKLLELEVFPVPTAIYLPSHNKFFLNKYASECLGLKENESFDLQKWYLLNPQLNDIYYKTEKNTALNQKALVTLFNNKREFINYNLVYISSKTYGNYYLICFSKSDKKYSAFSISTLYSLKEDVSKLKPYLNSAGKTELECIMMKYFPDEKKELKLDDLVYYEKELQLIQKALPFLSNREVLLCGLLLNNIESNDIASLTNRTMNSVFVTIHRINKKLNFMDKKELIDILRKIVDKE